MLKANKLLSTLPCGFCIINMVSKVFSIIEFLLAIKICFSFFLKFYSESDYFETYFLCNVFLAYFMF